MWRLLKQQFDEAGADLWFRGRRRGQRPTLSQVWYNLGLVRAELAEPELSRAAFAQSLALAPSEQVKAKLGSQARCQTSVRRAPALGDSVAQIVKGWLGVHKFLGSDGEPKNGVGSTPAGLCHQKRIRLLGSGAGAEIAATRRPGS